jgi:hypothetical protein
MRNHVSQRARGTEHAAAAQRVHQQRQAEEDGAVGLQQHRHDVLRECYGQALLMRMCRECPLVLLP